MSAYEASSLEPGEVRRVEIGGGHKVATYSFGSGNETLLLLNGGPGLACDYVRDSHAHLAGDTLRVVAFDQLGTGASDRPDDPSLWTIERYAQEVEAIRRALGLGRVHLYGHSWGAWLAIEYALTFPEAIGTLILCGGAASAPHLVTELNRMRAALGAETVEMMLRHEADGSLDHPEYKAATEILMWRHVCRLRDYPDALKRSIAGSNQVVYNTIQGPSEFFFTGNILAWDRLADLPGIERPALVLAGGHDICSPACAGLMHRALPDSRIAIFQASSHLPFFEEPAAFFAVLQSFLADNRLSGGSPAQSG